MFDMIFQNKYLHKTKDVKELSFLIFLAKRSKIAMSKDIDICTQMKQLYKIL